MTIEYADAYGLRIIINRCGVLTGPGQMGKSDQGVFALWMAAHYFQRDLNYIGFGGTGKQVRDLLHIDDLVDLVLAQIRHIDACSGKTFNVGGGLANSVSLRECTGICEEMTGNRIRISPVVESRPADVRVYVTDHGRISELLAWKPARDVRSTLSDVYGWICRDERALVGVLLG